MIRFLIQRPVAVFMTFTAFFILGIITYLNIPVSLLPAIDIPEISVHVSASDYSARELENTAVTPVRRQLLQVGKLRDLRSETRDGSAVIRLDFEFGTNIDLAFIEVNEKIDAAMGNLQIERPRVVKASATDIPVFNLNLTLKNEYASETDFLDLCEFAETVIRRRIEQLPQVSMVDITGLVYKQVMIAPDMKLLEVAGITLSDIETALNNNNNPDAGNMTVRDGYNEYSIKFSSIMRTVEDMRNIYIRKNDRIYQLKDLATVELLPQKEEGMSYFNGKRAVTLSVIKQSDENMDNLKSELNKTIDQFEQAHPDIAFDISQNQTELLDYTISNLQQNLILAFIFICLVSALFMRNVRSPLIIGLCMFISLIISLLFFYLCGISLNVISLTGLILALGMMIDNSIIVTDNIDQHRRMGLSLDDACVKGTNEVIAPMLSSSLTTISVFVPLVFLSGIAGALFFDQAFSVAVGLLVSYATGIVLLPVLYKLIYSFKGNKKKEEKDFREEMNKRPDIHERIYHTCVDWVFAHKTLTTIIMLAVFPLCYWLFMIIPKERMPELSQNEVLVFVEWNENIHVEENRDRVVCFLSAIDDDIIESSSLIGQQQFLLERKQQQTASESEVYLKTADTDEIEPLKKRVEDYFVRNYPQAIITFSPASTIFEQIFTTGEADLTAEYYLRSRELEVIPAVITGIQENIQKVTGELPTTVSFQEQLNLYIDKQKLTLYNISYNDIYQAIKTGLKENNISLLRSYQQYLPIVLGGKEKGIEDIIANTLISVSGTGEDGRPDKVPLSLFVSVSPSEDVKNIIAGRNGEYIPFYFYDTDQPEYIIKTLKAHVAQDRNWEVDFSGSFFSNRKMLGELMVILLISIMLMYFILAAQFESFKQPFIVLFEIPIDIAAALALLLLMGQTLNLMSAIGIVVTCGIIINDSILKVDIMNQLRKEGMPLMKAIHEAGRRRLNAILLTSLTTIVCMAPLLFSSDMGSELEKPLAIATIGGMVIGTIVSLFVLPLVYWAMYRKESD